LELVYLYSLNIFIKQQCIKLSSKSRGDKTQGLSSNFWLFFNTCSQSYVQRYLAARCAISFLFRWHGVLYSPLLCGCFMLCLVDPAKAVALYYAQKCNGKGLSQSHAPFDVLNL
jgi:hypothetical protein